MFTHKHHHQHRQGIPVGEIIARVREEENRIWRREAARRAHLLGWDEKLATEIAASVGAESAVAA